MAIQFVLHGSSFVGQTVLLPVNILKFPAMYDLPDYKGGAAPNFIRSDLLTVGEPNRWFMSAEYREGRIPLWNPHVFTGTPFARAPIFSPFELIYVLWPTPLVLPWIQLASALVGATGGWMVGARLLDLSPRSSVVAGVIYPLTGFQVLWQGFELTHSLAVFPWEILATMLLLNNVTLLRIVVLALVTVLEIIAGHVDMAAQVLVATGMIWLWHVFARWWETHSFKSILQPVIATSLGWGIGILMAAPILLPLVDYLQSSARVAVRASGTDARPPIGLAALPLVIFPDAFGSSTDKSIFVIWTRINQLESAAGCYCGAAAFLFAIPWAFRDRSRRRWVLCLVAFAILGASWQLDLPGFMQVWRLPGFRLFSANRFVFLTAWCLSLLAAIGLEQYSQDQSKSIPRSVIWGWVLTVLSICGCIVGFAYWPIELNRLFPKGFQGLSAQEMVASFREQYWHQLGWFLATAVCWVLAYVRQNSRNKVSWIVSALMILDLAAHAWNSGVQPDRSKYYPRLPVLEYVRNSPPGRSVGMKCLPPRLLESHGLFDIRGYDGVDPKTVMDVFGISSDEKMDPSKYSQTSDYAPLVKLTKSPAGIQLHPTMSMLGLRYLVCPRPMREAIFTSGGYSVIVNPGTMPRAWVPKSVRDRSTEDAVLNSISPWEFNPAHEAYLTNRPSELPEEASGEVELIEENSQRLRLSAKMTTTGLVVVGDRYDSDWQATVDGKPAAVHRVNYMLRGVVVPKGDHEIELVYRPAAFYLGVRIFFAMGLLILVLVVWSYRNQFRRSPTTDIV